MDVAAADSRFLKALAVAVVDHQSGTFKDIAQAAGVSKATLNRFCGTRANLVEMLHEHSSALMLQAVQQADLDKAEPLAALQSLIDGHLANREMLIFMMAEWRPDFAEDGVEMRRWQPYADAMDAFFLRGQHAGVFRIDISAPVLTELFCSMIFGLVESERRGRVARAAMSGVLRQFFLDGASARVSPV
ncbi:transcriptional regulator [Pseudomonas sp. DTU_2021_1001937_2_SI_NGA_ILE_001]|uniref:TetR/AcrR family transcriptional regulator n=1 Tax=Pseudomonas sp. DTU_2021_1001937_2_SI_NGA_ILE_001 TaxID=3077589 RepID=UPI0028FC1F85|nr:transcriptional regulator [Pseudomonas sp. DTU_2021_1001937_2_SI_NGA_ILE_001]WNW10036.1 transcriptional regulator [Pseudomonas sp. DTU_2021_1001937_2_SI_NGA_ILE_001]